MIHHVWTVLCTKSITNAETNAISLLEVPEEVTFYTEEGKEYERVILPLNFDLVSFWERQEDNQSKCSVRLTFVSPQGDTTTQGEYEIDLQDHSRARIVIRIPAVTVTNTGTYRFRLELQKDKDDWVEVASLPLSIKKEFILTTAEAAE